MKDTSRIHVLQLTHVATKRLPAASPWTDLRKPGQLLLMTSSLLIGYRYAQRTQDTSVDTTDPGTMYDACPLVLLIFPFTICVQQDTVRTTAPSPSMPHILDREDIEHYTLVSDCTCKCLTCLKKQILIIVHDIFTCVYIIYYMRYIKDDMCKHSYLMAAKTSIPHLHNAG